MIKSILEIISTLADNAYYFFRIGVIDFSSKSMDLLVSRTGTVPTILNYALDIWLAYYDCSKKAGDDKELKFKLLKEKWAVFVAKVSEFPMQFYYLSVWWAQIKRGDAAAIGLISPVIFMLKHFNVLA